LKIAFTPDRFEKVPIPIAKVERPISRDSSSRQRILVLEENTPVAAILKEMLQDHDFAIDVAFDANTAFSLLNQTEPQAVLLDILMPGLNGIDVLKQIRAFEKFRRTPIVVFTSEFRARNKTNTGTIAAESGQKINWMGWVAGLQLHRSKGKGNLTEGILPRWQPDLTKQLVHSGLFRIGITY
jgi:CheY-like chemotaxis protein